MKKLRGSFWKACIQNESGEIDPIQGWSLFDLLLLLLLSCFNRVWLCVTPQTAAHQAPPSLGFSRQEYWSGVSFPSPMQDSEKWQWSRLVVSDSLRSHGLQPTRLLHPWDFPGKSTGVGCHFLLQCMKVKSESEVAQSCPTLATPWTAAYQAPPSMGFSRQKYWRGVPLPGKP